MSKRIILPLAATAAAAVAVFALTRPSDAQQAAVPATAAPVATLDTSSLKGPTQPILFRHDIHSGQLKMQCQYCHYSVNVSTEPGIPSMQTCMGCHTVVKGTTDSHKAEIKKLTDAWTAGTPVEWVRVHEVARHVRFPHSRHIKALGAQACATCHGNVARMPQVYKVNNVNNMGWCVSCHLERNVTRDCTTCHY